MRFSAFFLTASVTLFMLYHAGTPAMAASETSIANPNLPTASADPMALSTLLTAEIALTRHQLATATNYYLQLASIYPDAAIAKRATQIAIASGNTDAAFSAARIWSKVAPHAPEAMLSFAMIAIQNHQPQAALQAVDQTLSAYPDWEQAIALRAQILFSSQNPKSALTYLQNILAVQPNQPALRELYGQMLINAGDLPAAEEQFQLLAKQPAYRGMALIHLAQLAIHKQQLGIAENYLKQAATDPAQVSTANYLLGTLADIQQQYSAAIQWYKQVNRGPYFLRAQIRIAAILAQQGKINLALDYLNNLRVFTSADRKQVYLAQAAILMNAKQPKTGIDLLNRALQNFPDDIDLLYAHSIMAEQLNLWDVVERDLKKVLLKNPKQVDALNALGYTLAEHTKRYKESLYYISRALTLAPNNPAILDSMGWVQYRLGNYKDAIHFLRKAASLSDDSEIAAHLGEALWVSGQQKEAKKIWEKALQNNPGNQIILDTMRRFTK